jgi:hypothetical protein
MFGPLRSLVHELNQAAHGVTATVTRPAPDEPPIVTTGIWLTHDGDLGFNRYELRQVIALPRTAVPTLPVGSLIAAPPPDNRGGAPVTWKVDGVDAVAHDHYRAVVVRLEE